MLVLNKGHWGSTRPSELAIVDPGSGRVVARIPDGIEPHEVAASPDGRLAVVTNTGPYSDPGHTLSVIDLKAQKEFRRVELGPLPNPHGIAWHDGKFYIHRRGRQAHRAVRPGEGSRRLDDGDRPEFDPHAGLQQGRTEDFHGEPRLGVGRGGLAVGPGGTVAGRSEAWSGRRPRRTGRWPRADRAAAPAADRVGPGAVPAAARGARPGNHPGGAGPRGDRHHARRHPGLGRLPGRDLDHRRGQRSGRRDDRDGPGGINRIKFTPDGKRALATHMGPLIILDVASRKEIKRIDTGGGGSSILVVPDGSRAYIGMTGADKVAVVDLGKLEVVSELETGEGPDGMAWVGRP